MRKRIRLQAEAEGQDYVSPPGQMTEVRLHEIEAGIETAGHVYQSWPPAYELLAEVRRLREALHRKEWEYALESGYRVDYAKLLDRIGCALTAMLGGAYVNAEDSTLPGVTRFVLREIRRLRADREKLIEVLAPIEDWLQANKAALDYFTPEYLWPDSDVVPNEVCLTGLRVDALYQISAVLREVEGG